MAGTGEGVAAGGRSPLESVMARLAASDGAALVELIDRHRADLARTVRVIAARRNARLGAGDVDELVTEAALAIADVAGAWRADGAPPWVYAHGRIAEAVDRHIGQWAAPLDDGTDQVDSAAPAPSTGSEPATAGVVAAVAGEHRVVQLLCECLDEVASARDRLLFFDHGVQVALGDPSPAVTVGAMYGMDPAAVRQQNRRVRMRLRRRAAEDPRFADLASLPIVA